jgi:hypothetical protein
LHDSTRIKGRCVYASKVPAGHARARSDSGESVHDGRAQYRWALVHPNFQEKQLRGDFVASTPSMDTDYPT